MLLISNLFLKLFINHSYSNENEKVPLSQDES